MSAYYNEFEPYAAQWLRNLIAAGHIAPGEVDERSITEVQPDDLRGYTQAHFFSGIGGWSLAMRLAGWDDARPVWTGSCPCQPFSAAGKQRGSDDERHLWPAFFRLIRECRPGTVFGEQVAGAAGYAWFDHVAADLEGEGYAAAACDIGAHSVGAPHLRQRLYWVAYTERWPAERRRHDVAAAPRGDEGQAWERQRVRDEFRAGCHASELAHAASIGGATPRAASEHGAHGPSWTGGSGIACVMANTNRAGSLFSERDGEPQEATETDDAHRHDADRCGEVCGMVDADDERLEGRRDESRERAGECAARSASPWRDLEWLACSDGKARPTEPGLFPLAHGVPGRVGRLRAYGNAIVPQVGAAFIEAVMECMP